MSQRYRFGQLETLDQKSLFLILNFLAVLFYFLVAIESEQLAGLETILYWAPDAQGYRDIADWQLGKLADPPAATPYRPFLFPLFLASIRYFTVNAYAVWSVHCIFWLLAVNFTSLSVWILTRRRSLYTLSFAILALNVSAIVQTFHALSETMVLLLASIWVYVFVRRWPDRANPVWPAVLTLLASLLVVAKPVFQLHLLLITLYLARYVIHRPKTLPLFLLALSPVFIQLVLMNALIGRLTISTISTHTLEDYFSSQVYALGESVTFEEARLVMDEFSTAEEVAYLARNPGKAVALYVANVLFQNLLQSSDLLGDHEPLRVFTRSTNTVYYGLHLIFLPLTVYVVGRKRGRKANVKVLYLFSALIIVSSGISFWQGDRLVITAMPYWLAAYMGVLHQLFLDRERRAARE